LKPDVAKNGNFFSGAKEIKVKEYSTVNYLVTFRPQIIADALAHLTLSNAVTND